MSIKSVAKKIMCSLPDELYIRLKYYLRFHKGLNLKQPRTFNEKLQWLKLYDRKPEYTSMVDKYEAKKSVAERIGENHIIPTLGVWEHFEDIDFDLLPNQFVLKCTHDSGGLVLCRDKSKLDKEAAKRKINNSLKNNYFYQGREWPYKNVVPRIIAEKYMTDGVSKDLTDYKFYCFNGVPQYLYISTGLENHATAYISFLTLDWKFAPFGRSDYKPFLQLPPKPSMFDEMKALAAKLAQGHKFLRVDLYQIDDEVYFSELTFSPCGGMMPFTPEGWDLELGKMLDLSDIEKNGFT